MSPIKKKYTLLLVDDEPRITSALRAIFRRNYKVLIANSGAQALTVLNTEKVHVIVSDQRMPEMLGNELLAIISQKYPQTMRILLTGFMDKQAIVDSINEGEIYRFINKPWNNEQIQEIVAEAALASEIPSIDIDINDTNLNDNLEPTASTVTPKKEQPETSENQLHESELLKGRAVLMIEKKQDIRHQIRKFCSQQSIMIYGTQNIEQAIAAATTRQNIGVAIVELSEDTIEAVQTINLLKQARPELITIVLTEEYDAHTAVDLINQGQVFKYLSKPLDIMGFQKAIQNAFLRHLFLKNNKASALRYKVQKTRSILSNLQNFFKRFTTQTSYR